MLLCFCCRHLYYLSIQLQIQEQLLAYSLFYRISGFIERKAISRLPSKRNKRYERDVLYLSACCPRETIVDFGLANNGCNEFRFYRHGHTVDNSGSRCSLHRKQAAAVSRLLGHVAGSLQQLLESFPLLAAQQSFPPNFARASLH